VSGYVEFMLLAVDHGNPGLDPAIARDHGLVVIAVFSSEVNCSASLADTSENLPF